MVVANNFLFRGVFYSNYLLILSPVEWTVFQFLPKSIGRVMPTTRMMCCTAFTTFGNGVCFTE